MLRNLTARIAVTSLLTLTGCLSLNAQAQAPTSTKYVFVLPGASAASTTTYTVSQAATPVLPVKVVVSDPNGITSASLSSKVGNGSIHVGGATSGALTIYFFDSYYAAGKSYTFTASVTNTQGVTTNQAVTVNLVK